VAPLADLNAALGRAQLARFDELLARRRHIAMRYFEAFPGDMTHALRDAPDPGRLLRFALQVDRKFERLQVACAAGGVSVRRGVDTLLHRAHGLPDARFPNAVAAYEGTLSVPFHPSLTEAEVDTVIRVVGRALGGHA
jgi:dTDP-4-amino-4,6-dideoxygalactose transaminase